MSSDSDPSFSQATVLRQFELVVQEKSIFVNAHYLAELSPYFRLLCFGNSFVEANLGRAELEYENYEEVLELMRFICPNSEYKFDKKVDESNFGYLIHFANLMVLPDLKQRLERYVEQELSSEKCIIEDSKLLLMIVESINAALPENLMKIMYKKLAKDNDLQDIQELVKDLPRNYVDTILDEMRKYIRMNPVNMPYRSAYNYSDYCRRMF